MTRLLLLLLTLGMSFAAITGCGAGGDEDKAPVETENASDTKDEKDD